MKKIIHSFEWVPLNEEEIRGTPVTVSITISPSFSRCVGETSVKCVLFFTSPFISLIQNVSQVTFGSTAPRFVLIQRLVNHALKHVPVQTPVAILRTDAKTASRFKCYFLAFLMFVPFILSGIYFVFLTRFVFLFGGLASTK